MDKTSFIGIVLGFVAIFVGMVMKGVSVEALVNPAALLIIFLGTAASVLIAFPLTTIKKVPILLKIIFQEEKPADINGLIDQFTEMSELTRREGILALAERIEKLDDPFLKSGLQMVTDGQTADFIRDVLAEKVDAMEKRHQKGAAIFTQAGTYAPTLGVLGAVVGLIAALGNLEDMEVLGHAISSAFIATLFGIFSGYVLWHPFANKLKEKSNNEAQRMNVMIEGVLSIVNQESPLIIKDKLSSYLPLNERSTGKEQVKGNAQTETA
ncbi:flagellar motor stator protein MotA [Bacillus piscicola]|uniref:flagellar motor stator protein MotA n=1 Tax=Bacillus piscicola TaxID=1632684 RepID=UPI001F09B4F9|nr:flagellar motor stator protein MotA [Bacillus piscicola]